MLASWNGYTHRGGVEHDEVGATLGPDLSRARLGRDIYSSEFRRTRDTIAPLGSKLGLKTTIIPARDMAGLVAKLRSDHVGEAVIVSGHSNTLPAIISALGVAEKISMTEADYDGLYFVTLGGDEPRLMKLSY